MKNQSEILVKMILITFLITACAQKKPSISEDYLLGDWYVVKGDAESYSFVKDDSIHTFTSYLHSRPFMYGTWKVEKQQLIIASDDGTIMKYEMTIKPDTLIFNNGEQIFTKTIPQDVLHPEIVILNELSSELNISFVAAPEPADFLWLTPSVDSTMEALEINLKGYETGLKCSNKSEDRTRIADYLLENGFELDTNYRAVTEITEIIGYWKGDQLVTLSDIYSQTEEGEIDPSIIWIRSGILNEE
jgi:hypothetical protein